MIDQTSVSPMRLIFLLAVACMMGACAPKESIVLRAVNINQLDSGKDGNPVLKADAVFFNPNSTGMKLRKVDIEIFVDGVKAGQVDQRPGTIIKPNSEFTVPLEVQLHLKEMGLVDALLSFIGGKKHEVQFTGKLKVSISGFPVRIPVDHKEQVRL